MTLLCCVPEKSRDIYSLIQIIIITLEAIREVPDKINVTFSNYALLE